MENFKFARKCDATGYGINEGYCLEHGMAYFADSADLIQQLRSEPSNGYEGMSDDFVLSDAFDGEMYYWTEWPELDEEGWYESEHEDGRDAVWVCPE